MASTAARPCLRNSVIARFASACTSGLENGYKRASGPDVQPDQLASKEINSHLSGHVRPPTAGNAEFSLRCTTVVQVEYNWVVPTRRKSPVRATRASIRQSVTIPAQLAREVRRVAKERNVTMSRALVTLAERGVEAEAAARVKLTGAYEKFMTEGDPVRKSEAGADLIRAIFGRDAIAEDPLR
jgi:hypothetical protein